MFMGRLETSTVTVWAATALLVGCGSSAEKQPYDANDPSTWSRAQIVGSIATMAEALCADPSGDSMEDSLLTQTWPDITRRANHMPSLARTELVDWISGYTLADGTLADTVPGFSRQLRCNRTFVVHS